MIITSGSIELEKREKTIPKEKEGVVMSYLSAFITENFITAMSDGRYITGGEKNEENYQKVLTYSENQNESYMSLVIQRL